MSTPVKNVIFLGASGRLGGPAVKQFLSLNSSSSTPLTVSALSRPDSTAIYPSGVKVLKSDYTAASLEEAFKGQDVVIALLGNEGIPQQKTIIDAAIKAGVKRYFPSEYGCRTYDERVRAIVPIFAGKRAIVEHLEANEGKISWTGVITGPFFDWGLKIGFLGFDVPNAKAKLLDNGTVPFGSTNLHTIGHALFALLSSPSNYEASTNKYIHIASHITTQNEILATLEKVTGKKFEKTSVSGKEQAETSLEKFKAGDFSAIPGLISSASWGKVDADNLGDLSGDKLFNEKLGLPKESLEADVQAVLEGKAP